MLDNMNDGVVLIDKEFRWVFCNSRFTDFLRLPITVAYPGASGYDILRYQAERGDFGSADDIEKTVQERAEMMRTPGGIRYERRTVSGRYVQFQYQPLADGSLLGFYRDITELRTARRRLRPRRKPPKRRAPTSSRPARRWRRCWKTCRTASCCSTRISASNTSAAATAPSISSRTTSSIRARPATT